MEANNISSINRDKGISFLYINLHCMHALSLMYSSWSDYYIHDTMIGCLNNLYRQYFIIMCVPLRYTLKYKYIKKISKLSPYKCKHIQILILNRKNN